VPLEYALHRQLTIPLVTAWCSLFSVIFLSIYNIVSVAVCLGQQALWLVLVEALAFFERPANVLDKRELFIS